MIIVSRDLYSVKDRIGTGLFEEMNAEEVKVGCFQVVIVLLLGINYVIVAMSHALPVFHNYTPKFYCQVSFFCLSYLGISLFTNYILYTFHSLLI